MHVIFIRQLYYCYYSKDNFCYSDEFAAMTGIVLLSLPYSIDENFPKQAHSRVLRPAPLWELGVHPPSAALIGDLIKEMDWQLFDAPGPLVLLYRKMVCVDKSGRVDNMILKENIMSLPEIKTRYQLEPWTVALLEQLRIILMSFHSTSLRFGLGLQSTIHKTFK